MMLSCDIGNSSSAFGVFDDNKLLKTFRIDTPKISSVQDLKKLFSKNIKLGDVSQTSVSSVVPSANPVYREFFKKMKIEPFFIGSDIKLNVKLCIENYEKIGSDRIANASYAHYLKQAFQIIIDAGTALTIDVINRDGNFLGGIIYPGLSSLANCLYQSTEKLPMVDVRSAKVKAVIGTNTETAILSGIRRGYSFLIKGFIYEICEYYNCEPHNLNVIFTGGHSDIIFDEINIGGISKTIDEHLTLKGIKYLYDINN